MSVLEIRCQFCYEQGFVYEINRIYAPYTCPVCKKSNLNNGLVSRPSRGRTWERRSFTGEEDLTTSDYYWEWRTGRKIRND